MSYSALYLKKGHKMLQLLGVLSFLSLLIGGAFLIRQVGTRNGWQQTSGIDKIYVVNRSTHGFDVVWSTKKTVTEDQWVEVGTRKGTYPIRGKVEKNVVPYYASITGLAANTHYYFRIRVGSKTYILPSLVASEVTTPKIKKEKPISPAYGKVINAHSRPYANELLIYEIDGYYPLAVFTKETGEWLLPLTGLIEKKNNMITSTSQTAPVLIRLFSFPEGSMRTSLDKTRPLKQVIIAGSRLQLAQALKQTGETVLGVSTQTLSSVTSGTSRIIYPKENAVIPGNAPLIRGTAPIGKDVRVLIQGGGKQYSYRAQADEKGDWMVQAPIALPFGRYTITVTIQNGTGATTIVKRNFTIIKSGEQVLGEATGSPTLAPTEAVIPTSPALTAAPTVALIPTIEPVVPTLFTPTNAPPITGGGISTYLFGALFFIILGTGLVLAF